jgi:hypothetical protein
MHVGALRNADSAIKEPLAEAVTRIGQAMDLVNGKEPDYAALQKRLQDIRESVPKGYKDSPVYGKIRDATDLAVDVASWAAAPAGSAIGAAEIAEELKKRGASLDEQRIGAVVGSLVGRFGKGVAQTGVGAAESALARGGVKLGSKLPSPLRRAGEYAADEAIDAASAAATVHAMRPRPKQMD